jgi:HEAT repeat protein
MGLFTPDISRLEKENNILKLLKCLDNRKASVRYRAFVALSGVKDPGMDVLTRMRSMVNDTDSWVKTIAVLKFTELGDVSIYKNLMDIIINGTRNVRIDLLRMIAGMGPTENQDIIKVIVYALSDKKEIIRRQAIIAAGAVRNKHLLPYLTESLIEKQWKLRLAALRAVHDIGGIEMPDYLIGLLADKVPEVRDEARKYLAALDNEYAQKAIHDADFMQIINGMNGKEPLRAMTAKKIGTSLIRGGLPLLHRACFDQYKGVRIEALKAMAFFKNPASIYYAAKLLHDKYHDVRLEAIDTLDQISDGRSREAIKALFDDRVMQVRDAAKRVYIKMRMNY